MAADKDTRKILKKLAAQGWRITTNANGHPMAWPPDKNLSAVTFSGTPGDRRSLQNAIALCRQRGAVL